MRPAYPVKGGSKSAAMELECQEAAREHERSMADAEAGEGQGTGDPGQAASMGEPHRDGLVESRMLSNGHLRREAPSERR